MENFITDLYRLAEFCEYRSLKGEMIRDRLVVGLRNDNFSEELQMNSDLTLEQPLTLEFYRSDKADKGTEISALRRFLGMLNQMGKYLPNLAQTSKPLRDLLSRHTACMLDSAQKNATKTIKRQLVATPALAIYDPQLQTKVIAAASSYGIRAVMVQKHQEGIWKPVAFITRALSSTEQKYAQIEKEALATIRLFDRENVSWHCETC